MKQEFHIALHVYSLAGDQNVNAQTSKTQI